MESTEVATLAYPVALVCVMAEPSLHLVGQVPVTPVPEVYGAHVAVAVPVLVRKTQTKSR